jgi:two-component system response regulator DegU
MSLSMYKSIKLAVVDDQPLFRKGLISLIKEFDQFDVIIDASHGQKLIEQLENENPDVILLDIEMPVMNGIQTTEYLRKKYPGIKILILTMHNEEEIIHNLIEKGAHGFLLKNSDLEIIIEAIHSVITNGYYFNDSVSKTMVKELVSNEKIKPIFQTANLSRREIEVIQLICKEFTNREIAVQLFISARTVDGHREKILNKINAKNTAGIVMYANKYNLL